jgi:hypothetical protein
MPHPLFLRQSLDHAPRTAGVATGALVSIPPDRTMEADLPQRFGADAAIRAFAR